MQREWVKLNKNFSVVQPAIEKMVLGTLEICSELAEVAPTFRPFHDNENAGVSTLLAGAARAKFSAVSEYPIDKRAWEVIQKKRDGKRLTKHDEKNLVQGRADLWLHDGLRAFSFEFKKTSERDWRNLGKTATKNDLVRMMNLAIGDIERVLPDEYHHSIGCLIAPVFDHKKDDLYRSFAEKCALCVLIGNPKFYNVYLYFSNKPIG
ncbi:hypothetical protein [Novosphingobium umbonatum]|nr:hypothetical protein [Novosphingobium umbonatum]